MKRKVITISCPHCGAEYLPAEIYLPDSFLGKPFDIEKEGISGKINDFFGESMNTEESYICDKCNQPFRVSARIQFITEGTDFRKDYTTSLKKQSLFLSED